MENGKYYSEARKDYFWIHKVTRKEEERKYPYCECDKRGKLLFNNFYSATDVTNNIEYLLGSECIKKFKFHK